MAIRVFNADDHPMLRKGIVDLLVESEGIEWVGSAENGAIALEKIKSIRPDVAILDIEMPEMTGLEAAKEIIDAQWPTKIILLTLFKDKSFIKKAFSIGVHGYLLKESTEVDIIDCIHTVMKGQNYISPSLTSVLLTLNEPEDNSLSELSEQELNILKLIAKDKTTAEISSMLFISPKTVSNHRSNINKKLQLDGQQNALLKWVIQNKTLLE